MGLIFAPVFRFLVEKNEENEIGSVLNYLGQNWNTSIDILGV